MIIHGFWTGNIGEVEYVSMKSFLYHKHKYHLWTYEKPTNIPIKVTWRDANSIVPIETFNKWMSYPFNHIKQSFANYFRYKLLNENGGCWCDLDVICLKPFIFDQEYVFCKIPDIPTRNELYEFFDQLGPYGNFANTIIATPPKCKILEEMIYEIESSEIVPDKFGTWGTVLLSKHILKNKLEQHEIKGLIQYGMSYAKRQFEDPYLPKPDCHAVHLFNYLNHKPSNKSNSLYSRLKISHLELM